MRAVDCVHVLPSVRDRLRHSEGPHQLTPGCAYPTPRYPVNVTSCRQLLILPRVAPAPLRRSFALVAACPPPPAQAAEPLPSKEKPIPVEPTSGSSTAAEEALKLDPFVISESDNVGYSANSTLAGT